MTAMSTASAPCASATMMPSSPMRLASGQAPVADAASRPITSGLVRSGYSARVAGSRVESIPNAISGRTTQPNANSV